MLEYVHSKGCKFCCSPFGLKSMKELLELKPDYVKIASPELNHYKMLEALRDWRQAQKEKGESPLPVILSSGVSTLADIDKAVRIVGREDVSILHCITSYPAPEEEYNLRVITNLKNILGIEAGVSDHSLDPALVPVLSVLCGGTVIEKHITLSRKTSGLDDPVALEPEQFALMVHVVHQTEAALRHYGQDIAFERALDQMSEQYGRKKVEAVLGDGVKVLAAAEEANYGRTNRSLHFMRALKKGERLGQGDIAILRTEKILTPGISPEYYDLLIGKKISRDVVDGAGVQLEDFILQ